MKLVIRTPIPWVAMLAWLAASAAWAGSPGDGFQNQNSSRATSRTGSRLSSRSVSQPNNSPAEPEPIAAPSGALSEGTVVREPDELLVDDAGGCCNDGCATGCCNGCCQGGLWYGSVDYLLVRTRFSQATAEVRTVSSSDTSTPQNTTITDQTVQFPFKYQSSFRAAIGYRLLDCGGDMQFAFWRLTGTSGRVSDGPTTDANANPGVTIRGIGDITNGGTNPGDQFFSATSGVTANIFDVDFAKCLAMGGPQHPCDACFCPRWDLRWSAGARIGDVSRFDHSAFSDASGNTLSFANINARFVGGGPRVGLQGRRYFGQCGMFSLYAKASQALLIGDYRQSQTQFTPATVDTGALTVSGFNTSARMIPVTDIEVGGTWQLAPYTFISAGWFVQCWWDLGQGETQGGPVLGALNTSNILGFDGLFIRGELLF